MSYRTTSFLANSLLLSASRSVTSFRTTINTQRQYILNSSIMNFSSRADQNNLFSEEINIIYDSKCNVCKLEMDFLARRDEKINTNGRKLKLTDLEAEDYNPNDPKNGGVTYADGIKAIHAVKGNGEVVKGVPVFSLAYEKVKLGWIFKITTWPIVKEIVDIGYTLFCRYRTNITRGASVESLIKEYESRKALEREMTKAADCNECQQKDRN